MNRQSVFVYQHRVARLRPRASLRECYALHVEQPAASWGPPQQHIRQINNYQHATHEIYSGHTRAVSRLEIRPSTMHEPPKSTNKARHSPDRAPAFITVRTQHSICRSLKVIPYPLLSYLLQLS